MSKSQLTMGSLFAGIGGFELGFERAGIASRWSVEIDPKCQSILRRRFPDTKIHGDINTTKTEELDGVDIISYGFPCTDLSTAGKRAGLTDLSGERTRSGLFFTAAEFISRLGNGADKKGPRVLVFENVPGLFSHDKGRTFGTVLDTLDEIGYSQTVWLTLDSRYFGVPQGRRRVFGISTREGDRHLGDALLAKIDFVAEGVRRNLEKSGEKEEAGADGIAESSGSICVRTAQTGSNGSLISESGITPTLDRSNSLAVLYSPDVCNTIRSGGDGGVPSSRGENVVAVHQNASGELRERDTANTVSTNGNASGRNTPLLRDGGVCRRFSVTEVERLMGFPDDWTSTGVDEAGKETTIADTNRMKMLGNAVVPNVVQWLTQAIIKPCLDFVPRPT